MRTARLLLVAVILFLAGSGSHPARATAAPEGRAYTFQLGTSAVIVARMGPGWSDRSRWNEGVLDTIKLVREKESGAPRAKLLLTPLVPARKELTLEAIRQSVRAQMGDIAPGSAEKELKIEERSAAGLKLIYFTATDAKPKPGEFLRMAQGSGTLGDVLFGFSLLYDAPAAGKEVLDMLSAWTLYGVADRARGDAKPDRARLEAACRQKDGLACGLRHELFGRGEAEEAEREWMEKGCNLGSAFACGSLAPHYDHEATKDEAKALALSMKSCDAHGALGCENAAKIIARRGRSDAMDPKAIGLFDRACGFGGNRDLCRMSGMDDEPSPEEQFGRQNTACVDSGRACRLLGWSFEIGYGTAVDVAQARGAYEKACKAGDLGGCFRQALLTADLAEQARLYQRACDQGSGPACYDLTLPPYGLPAPKRTELLRRACESDVQEACMKVAVILGSG